METHFQYITRSKSDKPVPQVKRVQTPLYALVGSVVMLTGIIAFWG